MTDLDDPHTWEPLEQLAARAPQPSPALADEVLARGRSAVRRRWVAAAASAALAVVAVIVNVELFIADEPSSSRPPVAASPTPAPTTESTLEPPVRVEVRAAVAATAIRALLDDFRENERTPLVALFVSDAVCPKPAALREKAERSVRCEPWSVAERNALLEMLADIAPVRLVDAMPHAGLSGRRPYVEVSDLRVEGSAAGRAFVFVLDGGGKSCLGQDYRVHRDGHGQWRPTGWKGSIRRMVIC